MGCITTDFGGNCNNADSEPDRLKMSPTCEDKCPMPDVENASVDETPEKCTCRSDVNFDILQGFFRRSIQQKIQYRPCTKNQQCSILRINRNRCQYCRLKKCIAVGMSRDGELFLIIFNFFRILALNSDFWLCAIEIIGSIQV